MSFQNMENHVMVKIFKCECPNLPGAEAIDKPDRCQQVLIRIISPNPLKIFSGLQFDGPSSEKYQY